MCLLHISFTAINLLLYWYQHVPKPTANKNYTIIDSLVLRNIPSLAKVGPDLPSSWDFGLRKGLIPGPRTLVAGSLQYLWGRSNQVREDIGRPHWALRLTGAKWTYGIHEYKKGVQKFMRQNLFSQTHSLSLSLSSLYKHLADLIVGGGSAGQPPAGLSCFAGQDAKEGVSLMSATSPGQKLHQHLAPSVGTTSSLLPEQNSERWLVLRGFLHQKRASRADLDLRLTGLHSRTACLYSYAVILWRSM